MEYICFDMYAYKLHIIKTNKFKSINVDVSFRRRIKKDEITIRNLIKEIMINSSSNYPSERNLIIETERLYDLKLFSQNYRVGNYSILSYRIKFLNEVYTKMGMNEESIKFLLDIIFNPKLDNDIDKCKKRIEKSILSLTDNKIKNSLIKLLETTVDKPYSYNSYGDIDDLEKIGYEDIKKYYDDIIKNDIIDVFIVGDVDALEMKEIFKKYFKATTFHKNERDVIVSELNVNNKMIEKVELDDVNQTQLTLLYAIKDLTVDERRYVLPIYGEMLGGNSNSILFDTVREKNSFAYYITALVKPYDNIMIIYSGIEKGNQKQVIKLINKCINDISKGKFEIDLFENAKKTIISSMIASLDVPFGIISNHYAHELVDAPNLEEKVEKIKEITKEDIINISKKIKNYSSYILEASDEKDNN